MGTYPAAEPLTSPVDEVKQAIIEGRKKSNDICCLSEGGVRKRMRRNSQMLK